MCWQHLPVLIPNVQLLAKSQHFHFITISWRSALPCTSTSTALGQATAVSHLGTGSHLLTGALTALPAPERSVLNQEPGKVTLRLEPQCRPTAVRVKTMFPSLALTALRAPVPARLSHFISQHGPALCTPPPAFLGPLDSPRPLPPRGLCLRAHLASSLTCFRALPQASA